MESKRVLIIGGGISGLSAAYYVNKSGVKPTLIELEPVLGGVIQTECREGCLLEAGPDSFLAAKPAALNLIRELGLEHQVIESNDHLRITYIVRGGKLIPLPEGMTMMVPTKSWPVIKTPLLSWTTKIRMCMDLLRPPSGPKRERSVYEFMVDHFGEEANDYLAEPLLAGVYGGDPRELSVNSVLPRFVELENRHGSLSRGVLAGFKAHNSGSLFKTLKGGLGQLVEALKPSADVVRGEAKTIERAQGGFRALVKGGWIQADQVIIATPAHQAAALLGTVNGELASLLASIPYTSSLTLSLVYRKSEFGRELRGFGFLVPKRERRHLVACTFVHNKFSFRAPDDKVVLRCFMGGDSLSESDTALETIARDELQRILGITAKPLFTKLARWPNSMAQYTVGHAARASKIEEQLRTTPGLHITGNGLQGIGIPDRILVAEKFESLSLVQRRL